MLTFCSKNDNISSRSCAFTRNKGEIIFYFMCRIYDKKKSQPLENKLSEFVKKNKIFLSSDLDIVSVCRSLNIQAKYMDLEDERLLGFILVNKTHRIIAVNHKLKPVDVRFIVAHELGHYIDESHGRDDDFVAMKDVMDHGEDKPAKEHDMDYLAAAMLVPKDQFIEDLQRYGVDCEKFKGCVTEREVRDKLDDFYIIENLARRYRVSDRLIIRRIAEVSYYA